jgi:hypothetical protein
MPCGGSINDREPGIPKHDLAKIYDTLIVRPSVPLRLVHLNDRIRENPKNPGNTTHQKSVLIRVPVFDCRLRAFEESSGSIPQRVTTHTL